MDYENVREEVRKFLGRWKAETVEQRNTGLSEHVFSTLHHCFHLIPSSSELKCFCEDGEGHELSKTEVFPARLTAKYLPELCAQLPLAAARLRERLAKFDIDLLATAAALNEGKE